MMPLGALIFVSAVADLLSSSLPRTLHSVSEALAASAGARAFAPKGPNLLPRNLQGGKQNSSGMPRAEVSKLGKFEFGQTYDKLVSEAVTAKYTANDSAPATAMPLLM